MAWSKVYYDTKRQDQVQTVSADNGDVTQTLIRTYIAVDNAAGAQPTTLSAMTANDGSNTVPLTGGLYTVDSQTGWKCTQVIPKRSSESPFVFELQATFVRKWAFLPSGKTKWSLDVSIKGQKFTQAAYQDKDGNDVINKAGSPFTEPALEKTFYDEVIEVSYLTTVADSATFVGIRGKVCSGTTTFNIKGMARSFAARQLLCDEVTMSSTITLDDNSTPVWKISATFIARQDKFTEHVKNQGYYELDGSGKLVPIMKDFLPVTLPYPLDNSGHKQAEGATPIYLDFKLQAEVDFSSFFGGF